MTRDELGAAVHAADVDTVVVAFTDMQGRLVGKRLDAEHFLHVADRGQELHGCNYLLAVDMEMEPVPGYEIASWERGYGDFVMRPDLATLRRIPWLEGSALVLCDLAWPDGLPVRQSPRQVLKAQLERARALGFETMFASELEFYLLQETYAQAHARGYDDLTPSVPYNLDYHVLATSFVEPFMRSVRRDMKVAGIPIESSKGEAWPGQHEINFRAADALATADNHVVFKTGLKEMAARSGCSVTFMAKPYQGWIGSSCHIHSSLWRGGRSAFAGEGAQFRHYLAGLIGGCSELAIFLAPNVNSYKRYAAGSWAPTTLAWDYDNRTCGFRVVGRDDQIRVETRIPGADVNPYLAFAALLAAGLDGIENEMEPPARQPGNAYESGAQRFPATLRAAISALESGRLARAAFGEDVVMHYLNYARTEQELFDRAVTDYERRRLFERI